MSIPSAVDRSTPLLDDPPSADLFAQGPPTLGGMSQGNRLPHRWLLPLADFLSSSLTLALVLGLAGASIYPAFPVAAALCVFLFGVLGFYGRDPEPRSGGWPVGRILIAALFAWFAGLIAGVDTGDALILWGSFAILDFAAHRGTVAFICRRQVRERWVLVGEEWIAARLRRFTPLRPFAEVVGSVVPDEESSRATTRSAALEIVEHYRADRVVIATKHADDDDLLELVRTFRSTGVGVSLMPRPLGSREASTVKSRQFGGVPLMEVEALTVGLRDLYVGPERRRERQTEVTVVVPAMNEEKNIGEVLRRLPAGLHQVILVDGRSTDRTVAVAEESYPGIKIVEQRGRGKGDALRLGFAAVTGNAVVMLDADGSADPAEIPRFMAALEDGADFAKGSRYLDGGGSDDITPLRTTGNKALSGAANILHGTHFTDLCYGYNAFWVRCLPFISLDTPGFEVETLINVRMAAAGMRITEVPSYELNRTHGTSNLNTFRDGFRVLRTILAEAPLRWSRQRRLQRSRREAEGG